MVILPGLGSCQVKICAAGFFSLLSFCVWWDFLYSVVCVFVFSCFPPKTGVIKNSFRCSEARRYVCLLGVSRDLSFTQTLLRSSPANTHAQNPHLVSSWSTIAFQQWGSSVKSPFNISLITSLSHSLQASKASWATGSIMHAGRGRMHTDSAFTLFPIEHSSSGWKRGTV